jgi:hypothetical protein
MAIYLENNDAVVSLFYLLLRDHILAGSLEAVLRDIEKVRAAGKQPHFSNEHLEAYARELTIRLLQ